MAENPGEIISADTFNAYVKRKEKSKIAAQKQQYVENLDDSKDDSIEGEIEREVEEELNFELSKLSEFRKSQSQPVGRKVELTKFDTLNAGRKYDESEDEEVVSDYEQSYEPVVAPKKQ